MRFLLKRVATDHEVSRCWARYHVVRHALRRQPLLPLPLDFAAGVMARLEREPIALRHAPHRWLRWSAGGAIAASVAVAALMVTRPTVDEPVAGMSNVRTTSVRATSPVATLHGVPTATAAVAARAGVTDFRPPLLAPNAPVETAPASFGTDLVEPVAPDPRMQSYLIRHYQATGAVGQPNFVPYVLLGTPQREVPTQSARQNR
jgi:sigma-E factor negative regulatory protein RseA